MCLSVLDGCDAYIFAAAELFSDEIADLDDALLREQIRDQKRKCDADCGVEYAVERIGNIAFNGLIEQHDAKHNAAGLYRALPFERIRQKNEEHDADENEREHKCRQLARGAEDEIHAEKRRSDKSSEDGAEKTVSTVQTRVCHIAAESEYSADAGERGISADEKIDKRADRNGNCRFNASCAVKIYVIFRCVHWVPLCSETDARAFFILFSI